MHGGTTPRGLALPQTKTGITSADFPTRMRARVEAMMIDPDLMTLNAEAAGLSARGVDILSRVDSGEAGRLWQRAQVAATAFRQAQRDLGRAQIAKDAEKEARAQAAMREALDALLAAVDAGSADWAAWEEWGKVVEAKRRVVETATKIAERRDYMVPADQVLLALVSLAELGRQHIDDPATRNRYAREASVVIEGLRARVPGDLDGALTG